MENLLFKNNIITFRKVDYNLLGWEPIDDDSVLLNLDENLVCFYYNDITINNVIFKSLVDLINYLGLPKK
ncbi:MAG: hypothetical protein E6R13_06850 [Spirochaetes bacterium]|nr:MAG: hypothetical protein E6R13_06850 [Spirochaetota bacterium]